MSLYLIVWKGLLSGDRERLVTIHHTAFLFKGLHSEMCTSLPWNSHRKRKLILAWLQVDGTSTQSYYSVNSRWVPVATPAPSLLSPLLPVLRQSLLKPHPTPAPRWAAEGRTFPSPSPCLGQWESELWLGCLPHSAGAMSLPHAWPATWEVPLLAFWPIFRMHIFLTFIRVDSAELPVRSSGHASVVGQRTHQALMNDG